LLSLVVAVVSLCKGEHGQSKELCRHPEETEEEKKKEKKKRRRRRTKKRKKERRQTWNRSDREDQQDRERKR
jgi:hypothetical protein